MNFGNCAKGSSGSIVIMEFKERGYILGHFGFTDIAFMAIIQQWKKQTYACFFHFQNKKIPTLDS